MRNPPLRATSEHSTPLYLGHHADQEVVLLDGRLGGSDVVLQDLAGEDELLGVGAKALRSLNDLLQLGDLRHQGAQSEPRPGVQT